jgi:SAM-dependent methyltransferase
MESDRERWDERHRAGPTVTPAPPEAIAARPDLLALVPTAGRALDVACGSGSTTVWMAGRGLSVRAVDVSPVALDRVRSAAAAAGVERRVETVLHDLDDGLPDADSGRVGGVGGAAGGRFDVVVCQRFRAPHLYGPLVEALVPGGIGVVTVLSRVGRAGEVGPFHAPAGELLRAFDRRDVELLEAVEADGLASVVLSVR